MSEPFLAEVRIVGFNFAPRGWAMCDGQILPISQNQALYSLLGTTYGGDGRTTFALPDLRGRTPIHMDNGHIQGQKGGEEAHALTTQEMPRHDHGLNATSDNATTNTPTDNLLARSTTPIYHDSVNLQSLARSSVADTGSSQSHDNMQPFLALNFVIALRGLFPSRN